MVMGCVQPGTSLGMFLQMIGSRKTVPPRIFLMVPLGLFHIFFKLNSICKKNNNIEITLKKTCYGAPNNTTNVFDHPTFQHCKWNMLYAHCKDYCCQFAHWRRAFDWNICALINQLISCNANRYAVSEIGDVWHFILCKSVFLKQFVSYPDWAF